MIIARHRKLALSLYNPWMDRLVRKRFSHFYLTNDIPELPTGRSLLITPNHMSWWDPFFIDVINRRMVKRRLHVMMLEEQLRHYWFFQYVGAYSINPSKKESVAESLAYTASVLGNPENFVILFPQGKIEPYDKRPVELKEGGVTALARQAPGDFVILPVAQKIVYDNKPEPDVFVRFGNLVEPELVTKSFVEFTGIFRENIARLDQATLDMKLTFKRDLFTWNW